MIINPSASSGGTTINTTIVQLLGIDGIDGEEGFSISGSQGIQGFTGIQGPPGDDGLPGDDGIPGVQGIQGIQGLQGFPGQDGLDTVSDDFYPGFNPFRDDPLEQIPRIQDQNVTILPNYSAIIVGPYTINSGKKLTIGSGGRFQIWQGATNVRASIFVKQSSVFTDSVTTEVMAGLGSNQTITPAVSGVILITLSGYLVVTAGGLLANSTLKMYYGTGSAPAAGSAPIGIQIGNQQVTTIGATTGAATSFSITVLASGLTTGTAYWFDISVLNTVAADTVTLNNVNFVAIEQPLS